MKKLVNVILFISYSSQILAQSETVQLRNPYLSFKLGIGTSISTTNANIKSMMKNNGLQGVWHGWLSSTQYPSSENKFSWFLESKIHQVFKNGDLIFSYGRFNSAEVHGFLYLSIMRDIHTITCRYNLTLTELLTFSIGPSLNKIKIYRSDGGGNMADNISDKGNLFGAVASFDHAIAKPNTNPMKIYLQYNYVGKGTFGPYYLERNGEIIKEHSFGLSHFTLGVSLNTVRKKA
jgi:hypothetical protein